MPDVDPLRPADFKPFLEAVQPVNDIEEMTHDQVTAKATGVAR